VASISTFSNITESLKLAGRTVSLTGNLLPGSCDRPFTANTISGNIMTGILRGNFMAAYFPEDRKSFCVKNRRK
jgi:hypothetical protein